MKCIILHCPPTRKALRVDIFSKKSRSLLCSSAKKTCFLTAWILTFRSIRIQIRSRVFSDSPVLSSTFTLKATFHLSCCHRPQNEFTKLLVCPDLCSHTEALEDVCFPVEQVYSMNFFSPWRVKYSKLSDFLHLETFGKDLCVYETFSKVSS